jgi:acyl carrier protein
MDGIAVRQKLSEIFADTFGAPGLQVRDDMTADDVEGWDSLSHIDLIVAVEEAFQIRLTTADVRNLNTVGDLVNVICRKAS